MKRLTYDDQAVDQQADTASNASKKGGKKRKTKTRMLSGRKGKSGVQVTAEQFEKLEDRVTLLKAELDMLTK